MPFLAAVLSVFALGALILAVVAAVGGPRKADRLGAAVLPEALRGGSTGGLLTALEGVGGRWTRAGLLLLAALACAGGAALVVAAF
ncbi:MAG: hypothetical protein GC145_02200 [Caulobacter sp.]|nr:hypothetical protein [Caulobacter sp.]